MNRYSGPASKASASTLCQKCLKRGHYSYECTAPAQARPYVSRPSRTQQLLNPKLVPKLTSDVPNELLYKEGVADKQLAKAVNDRGRKRQRLDQIHSAHSGSSSARSSTSVSSISTNKSPSPTAIRRKTHGQDGRYDSSTNKPIKHSDYRQTKRRRTSRSRSRSPNSSTSSDSGRALRSSNERRTRRRISSSSPRGRGRRRSRSYSRSYDSPLRKHSRSRSRSIPSDQKGSRSPGKQRVDHRYVLVPRTREAEEGKYRSKASETGQEQSANGRELSPFSRRLALTQAMNR